MKRNLMGGVFGVILAVTFFLFISGCSQPIQMASQMPDEAISIDGIDNEWKNWFYQDEKTDTSAAFCNDDDNVYICFTTTDTELLSQIVQKGFVIWFNSKGNKDKELGINFPFVSQGGPGGPGGAPPEGGGAPPGGGRDPNSVSVAELKILTSEKDEGKILTLEEAEELGIGARISSGQGGGMVYELKMPRNNSGATPYVVQASAENIIGVGLMTYSERRSRVSGISGFGGSMGDMGGGGMGGGGGMPGGGGGGFDSSAAGGFSASDMSGMSKIYEFFGDGEDVSAMTGEDVSAINAQGGGAPPGGGMGGDMGGDMGGGMSGGMGGDMGAFESSFEIWAKITLAGD